MSFCVDRCDISRYGQCNQGGNEMTQDIGLDFNAVMSDLKQIRGTKMESGRYYQLEAFSDSIYVEYSYTKSQGPMFMDASINGAAIEADSVYIEIDETMRADLVRQIRLVKLSEHLQHLLDKDGEEIAEEFNNDYQEGDR